MGLEIREAGNIIKEETGQRFAESGTVAGYAVLKGRTEK